MPTAVKAYPGGCCLLAMLPPPEGIAVLQKHGCSKAENIQ